MSLSFETWQLIKSSSLQSTIYLSLVILSERPFVANGHLNQGDESLGSWTDCTVAAEKIAHLLHAYRETYSFRCVPYQLCYATYVASTILVRNANAPGTPGGHVPSVRQLAVCLQGFHEMKLTHPGTSRMEERIRALMGRLDVNITDQIMANPGIDCTLCSLTLCVPAAPPKFPANLTQVPYLHDVPIPTSSKKQNPAKASEDGGAGSFQSVLPGGASSDTGLQTAALASFPGAYGAAEPDATAAFLAAVGHHQSPLAAGPFGEQMWNFPIQDINDDILFGALRDSWV